MVGMQIREERRGKDIKRKEIRVKETRKWR